jgi:tetratricopeptide (TPR) repeat protein
VVRLKADTTDAKVHSTDVASGLSRTSVAISPVVSGFSRSLAVCLFVLAIASCGSQKSESAASPGRPVDRKALPQVSLPDLAKVDKTAQKQLRDGFASLSAKRDNPSTTDVDLGRAYGEMGKLLMAAEYRDVAEISFLNAEALEPREASWPYYLAHLYKLKGDSKRSSEAFERALRLEPDDLATLVWLGNEYLNQGRASEADTVFTHAFSLQPKSVPVLAGLGRTALAKQEYSRAVQYLEQALSIDPKAIVLHYPLALAYRGLGNPEQAEAHLRARGPGDVRPPDPKMLAVDSLLESAVSYEVRGAAALDESNWPVAAENFRRGVALAPNEPSLRHKLGTALAMQGDLAGAVQQFEEVTRRWPKFAKAHYSLGLLLSSNGHPREALVQFSDAVKADPTYSEARLQLADGLRQSGHVAESLQQYEETIRLNPSLAEARLGYGMALATLNRFAEARTQLTEGARIFPDRREFADALARLPPAGSGRP